MDPSRRLATTMAPALPAVKRAKVQRKRERSPGASLSSAASRLSLRPLTPHTPQPSAFSVTTEGPSHSLTPASTNRTSTSMPTSMTLRNDRLGASVARLMRVFHQAQSWEEFVNRFRGRSYLSPDVGGINHPASKLLQLWMTEGVPIHTSDEPWSPELKDARFLHGCHRSASQHAEFLRDELAEFIESGFWVVLPYELVKHLPELQLSPCSVKEERERRPRLLCDHSWFSTNENTLPNAPPQAMQFGRALERILHDARHANP